MQPKKQAIFLMGPTAAGKTNLAIQIAQLIPVDLISVDSAMIYRQMNIGTGKPSAAELKQAPHALIDILDPAASYSAAKFCQDAAFYMEQSVSKGRIPLLVGGTMMYFQALQYGLSTLPNANPSLRQQLLLEAKQFGWATLYKRLTKLDPMITKYIHPNDQQRIQRALEIITITGQPYSQQLTARQSLLTNWEITTIALAPNAKYLLHDAIEIRFQHMLQQGFIEEVTALFKRADLHADLPAIRTVGYRQIWQFLAGKYSQQEMLEKAIIATRQLAKRQFTWLRKWPELIWLDNASPNLIAKFLQLLNF